MNATLFKMPFERPEFLVNVIENFNQDDQLLEYEAEGILFQRHRDHLVILAQLIEGEDRRVWGTVQLGVEQWEVQLTMPS